ncbi:hypothetical protein V1T76_25370 [Roseibium sp. FZY0029]|uniref:hypothetical protein n=1 Tax=Roseibium sp. FZY0029 TaxID=3116647 RepID=UPI002EC2221D|nr:hypothetical protein [Roseibium sp. FZY0029]
MKILLIDVINVLLIRDEKQNYVLDAEVLGVLELLLSQGVPMYAVSMVSRDQWKTLQHEFPAMKPLFQGVAFPIGETEDPIARTDAIKHFLNMQGVPENLVFYVFDSSVLAEGRTQEFYDAFRNHSEVEPNFYDPKRVSPYWLKIRLVASKLLYRFDRSTDILLNEKEKELCGILVRYLAIKMCRLFYDHDFEMLEWTSPEATRSRVYDEGQQIEGRKFALMTEHGVRSYELAVSCLMEFDLVSQVLGYYYEMLVDVDDIPKLLSAREDLHREQLGWAIETFFDMESQDRWNDEDNRERSSLRHVEITLDIVDSFLANGLIEYDGPELVWSEKMDPYFLMAQYGKPNAVDSEYHFSHEEEAGEFFRRICGPPQNITDEDEEFDEPGCRTVTWTISPIIWKN